MTSPVSWNVVAPVRPVRVRFSSEIKNLSSRSHPSLAETPSHHHHALAALARAARVGLGVIATLDASFGVFGVFGVAAAFLVRFFVASSSPSSPAFEDTDPNGARAGVRRRRVDVPGVARGAVSGSGDARLRLLDGVFAADLGAEDFGAEDFGAEDFGAEDFGAGAATGVRLGLGSVVVASSSSAAAAAADSCAFSALGRLLPSSRVSLRQYVSASALASSMFLSAAASAFSAAAAPPPPPRRHPPPRRARR